MASIREFRNKDGSLSFQIRVSRGRDLNGKLLKPFSTTYRAEPTWSDKTARKRAQDFAAVYERDCLGGVETDSRVTFQEYAEYVIDMKVANGTLKPTTEHRYREFTKRIYPVMGYMKIKDIKPAFLNKFYTQLLETPLDKESKAISTPKLKKVVEKSGLSMDEISRRAHCSHSTLKRAIDGYSINLKKATVISEVLGCKVDSIFRVELTAKTLSPKTVKEYHRFISSVLSQAEKEMLVPYNMAKRATTPKQNAHEANYFEPEMIKEIEAAFDKEPGQRRLLGYMLIFTGARRGEVLGLEWHNVNWEKNTIKIEKNVVCTPSKGVYVDTPKTVTSKRTISMPQLMMDMLSEYKEEYDLLKEGLSWKRTAPDNDFIFVRDNGLPMRPDTLSSWLTRVEEKNGLPHLNAHAFRHSVASALIFHGVDPVSVSKRLGHNQVSTTTNIYSHIMSAAEQRNAEILSEIFA